MKSIVMSLLLFTSVFAFAGQPELVQATTTPDTVSIGDSVTVAVEFTGKPSDLDKVYLVVRGHEYDTQPFYLQPRESLDQNVWTAREPVPYNASAAVYHLDINAIDKGGKEIVTEGYKDNVSGKAGSIDLTVTY
ncbi:MAG: hypothetical protein U5R06_05330 [candidate division KSB1 bacterium]|nr:hypothetical protein [candidate division KSB1 bacterium]